MPHLLRAARGIADDFLTSVGTCLCFLGAIYDVLDRLSH